jgi:hypothetical protein
MVYTLAAYHVRFSRVSNMKFFILAGLCSNSLPFRVNVLLVLYFLFLKVRHVFPFLMILFFLQVSV